MTHTTELAVPAATLPEPLDYAALLGAKMWNDLPAATRARFATHTARYTGQMTLHATALGRWLARAAVLIGSPLPPASAAAVPAEVLVAPDPMTGGSVWIRRYSRPHGVVEIRSVKALDRDGMLVEQLAFGLRMRLDVHVRNGELHFVSTGYCVELGPWRVPLPSWSLPGRTHVVHKDLGNGRFLFTMTIRHRWLGELLDHRGVFGAAGE